MCRGNGRGPAASPGVELAAPGTTGVVSVELSFDIGAAAITALGLGAVALGLALQAVGETRFGWEWAVTAVAAFIGGVACSEWIVGFQAVEPVWDGMAVLPAIGGLLVVGVVVDAIIRFTTHGSYRHHAPV